MKPITQCVAALILPVMLCHINNVTAQGTIKIGTQIWTAKNLNVSKFRNGEVIPEAKTVEEWVKAGDEKKPAWCYYKKDTANGSKYGKLYNWYAVNDSRGLAPKGWHVPSYSEWNTLISHLGGLAVAGGKLKEVGLTHWSTPNTAADNSSGFTGLPGGFCFVLNSYIVFGQIGENADWWGSDPISICYLSTFDGTAIMKEVNKPENGYYVRCIKD